MSIWWEKDSLSTLFTFEYWTKKKNRITTTTTTTTGIYFTKKSNGDAWMCLYVPARFHQIHTHIHIQTLHFEWFEQFNVATIGAVFMVASPQSQFSVGLVAVLLVLFWFKLVLRNTIQVSNLKFSCHVTESMRDSMQ